MEIVWKLHFKLLIYTHSTLKIYPAQQKSEFTFASMGRKMKQRELWLDYKHFLLLFWKKINKKISFILNLLTVFHFNCKLNKHLIYFSSVYKLFFSTELCININKCFCSKLLQCLNVWKLFDCHWINKLKSFQLKEKEILTNWNRFLKIDNRRSYNAE